MTSRKKDKAKTEKTPPARTIEAPDIPGKAAEVQDADEKPAAAFPIVGIGASAGGLAAFEAFFSGMPADTDPDMAFVLVQHLAPDHKSILADLIRRYTRMQVFEVEDGMTVQPNCAYIIPPNRDMAFLNGTLQLMEPSAPRGQRLPIDFFLRSLAQDQHERAICIVLSGTGSDGTLGVRAIKGEGGMVMVQSPESTEYDGMPRSAIATGLVDYELPPAEMPVQIMAYVAHAFGKPPRPATVPVSNAENAIKKIFILLRSQTGNDFSQYKSSSIHRRIERRMAVHHIDAMDSYVRYLQQTPPEVEALFRDLLIGVTKFFRDPEAFKVIEEQAIPKLLAGKPESAMIRIWSPGCSTGEEAYSLAILIAEHQEAMKRSCKVQVFATDIDSQAIATARAGIYPASIATDISKERLARFFVINPDGGTYRIHKSIRDILIFSEQNVIKDPPFSKLDLISCRNLLIYLGGDLQKKLFPLFHYALNPSGFLFLGTSETVGNFDDLFAVLNRKSKLYQRKDDFHSLQHGGLGRFLPPMTTMDTELPQATDKTAFPGKLPLRELTEQVLLQQVALAGALVNGQGDIFYLHGRTGLYLEPAIGETGGYNILKMAREGLQRELTTALHKAARARDIVRCPGLRVKTNGDFATVNLTIRQVVTDPAATTPLYLVILEEAPLFDHEQAQAAALQAITGAEAAPNSDADARIAALNLELRAKDEYLQTSNEELETSNEELKSSNEEMQSVNEELQSTNEELETSKEELQSVNEELATVNSELQTKVTDLSRANNDMNNLLAGTGIGTVFVNHQLCILRFTPAASTIINLILSDIGRPVGHIVSNLVGYNSLVADIKSVLKTLVPKEVEVQTTEGKWYAMRIQPYRTLDNVIEGAVISFVDITEMKQMRELLQKANEQLRLAVVVRDSHDVITYVGINNDITERKQAEAEKAKLEAQNRQLQKAESLGRMAGAIAHHFNNQLQVVMGNLEMAMNDLPQGSAALESLTEALKAAHKAAVVSGQMLSYLGQTPYRHESLDLSEACRQSLALLQAAAPKGMIIDADFPSSGPVIRANAGQIMQVLTNLVTNAWEAADENRSGIGITVKTVSRTDIPASKRFPIDWQPRERDYACLEVTDAGCGIAGEDIEKLFDPFYSTKFTGRGMGLSVVLGIVRAHNGGLTVESEPGRGNGL